MDTTSDATAVANMPGRNQNKFAVSAFVCASGHMAVANNKENMLSQAAQFPLKKKTSKTEHVVSESPALTKAPTFQHNGLCNVQSRCCNAMSDT
jgi:hypothetical protein